MTLESFQNLRRVPEQAKEYEAAGRSSSALSQYRGMLYQIMNKAEANDLIHKNPVRYAEKTRQKGPAERKEAFISPPSKASWATRR